MNLEIAKQWTDALRSGEYKQGRSVLCRDGKYCCLGVLCEIAKANGLRLSRKIKNGTVRFGGDSIAPPLHVQRWAGLKSRGGTYVHKGHRKHLADDNDGGKTFAEIADLITAHAAEL
jgi:hypothetical protein